MRELWQQTGMITNGRKLLVDSLSEEDEIETVHRKNVTKKLKRTNQCKVHPKLSSSSSGKFWNLMLPQCGNFMILVSFRFYVKSVLRILEVQNQPI